jgi:uncharacterized protein YcfJ
MANKHTTRDTNPDPITGAPGSHPIGTGLGAAAGGLAAGAAAGAVAGPVGAAVGAVVGAVAGGLGGKAIEEQIDPTAEDAYWRDNYRTRSYVASGDSYDTYRPAYEYGWESRRQHRGKRFDDVESDLAAGWQKTKANTGLGWDKAKYAARDAWDRVERALPGDADGDGK